MKKRYWCKDLEEWEVEEKFERWLSRWHKLGFEFLWHLMNHDTTLNFDFVSFFEGSAKSYANDELLKIDSGQTKLDQFIKVFK